MWPQLKLSPCETCGACCAFFCVSFPDDKENSCVPVEMSSVIDISNRFMNGTKSNTPRCIALEGSIGVKVKCRIYENRPSACRQFSRSWENDEGNFLCDKARSFFSLQPFSQY